MVKNDRHKASGLLMPLPVPQVLWESIAMDFVFDLPRSNFIPIMKTIKADRMARIFMAQIFKYHGMPKSIVSDYDPRMTSLFCRAIFDNMGIKLDFYSLFHP